MKISILIITFNHEKYIEKAIEGILIQQDCFDFEVIISDDCSNDETVKLATKKLNKMPNLLISINEKNLGITKNYQKGFSLCSGEYILVLEGDDYWIDPYKVKQQVEFLENNPFCSMCFHPFILQKDDSPEFDNLFRNDKSTYSDLFSMKDILFNEGLIANFSVCCYRKLAIDSLPVELYNITSYDWMVNISIAQFGFLGRINHPMSVYRWAEGGTWASKSLEERLNNTLELLPDYDRVLNYRYSNLFNQKAQMLKDQIRGLTNNNFTLKSFIPPIFILFIKILMPPAILNYLRK